MNHFMIERLAEIRRDELRQIATDERKAARANRGRKGRNALREALGRLLAQ
jgi:hypothetical protein